MIGSVFAKDFYALRDSRNNNFIMKTRSVATVRYGASYGKTCVLFSDYFELITYSINFGVCSVYIS